MKVTFWLIPAAGDRALLQDIINQLAQTYDAPVFTPHVTIYVGHYLPDESPVILLDGAIQGIQPFSLTIDRLLYSEFYTKTVFVQFQPSERLSQISETLRQRSRQPSGYELNPHLSLIYQHLSEMQKQEIITTLKLPQSTIQFDEVWAVATPESVQNRADVERWAVLGAREL